MYIVIDADKFGAILETLSNIGVFCFAASFACLIVFILYRFVILPRQTR